MKSAKMVECFPYTSKLVCYMEVTNDGGVKQVDNPQDTYANLIAKKSKLYAVWPGSWRSDLFEIDDLDAYADAHGIPREDNHVHKITWKVSEFGNDNPKSQYIHIYVVFECGCEITENNIKKIANDLHKQFGWDVATSKGFGYHTIEGGKEYGLSVRKTTLKK